VSEKKNKETNGVYDCIIFSMPMPLRVFLSTFNRIPHSHYLESRYVLVKNAKLYGKNM
jgi:hypothetical protein